MKKNVQTTSIDAYYSHTNAKRNARALYSYMRGKGAMADFQLVEALGWEVNEVTGRRNDLIAEGLVVPHGHTINPLTKKRVRTWRAVERSKPKTKPSHEPATFTEMEPTEEERARALEFIKKVKIFLNKT